MKICTKCKLEKPLEEFSKRAASKDGLQPSCKDCHKLVALAYYENNKESEFVRIKARIRANYNAVWKYKEENPCVDCGESDPIVLDFDHVRGEKTKGICEMIQQGNSLKNIFAEIEKCDIRCANCHRRVTHFRKAGLTLGL